MPTWKEHLNATLVRLRKENPMATLRQAMVEAKASHVKGVVVRKIENEPVVQAIGGSGGSGGSGTNPGNEMHDRRILEAYKSPFVVHLR